MSMSCLQEYVSRFLDCYYAQFLSSSPWHLTGMSYSLRFENAIMTNWLVVRTQGVLFLRPEKSWRPIVTITLEDNVHMPYELMLGCDGQNPNLKMPFVLCVHTHAFFFTSHHCDTSVLCRNDVDESSRLDIKLWHKSHRKSRRKQHMVGSAYVTLGELLKRQEMSGQGKFLVLFMDLMRGN